MEKVDGKIHTIRKRMKNHRTIFSNSNRSKNFYGQSFDGSWHYNSGFCASVSSAHTESIIDGQNCIYTNGNYK